MTRPSADLEPDTKDWTWVLERRCDECGLDARSSTGTTCPTPSGTTPRSGSRCSPTRRPVSARDPTAGRRWSTPATSTTSTRSSTTGSRRCSPRTLPTSPTGTRTPRRSSADYASQLPVDRRADPGGLGLRRGRPLRLGAPLSWHRRGVRSDGSEFTVESLGRYHLHDVVHHLHDVRDGSRCRHGPGLRRLRRRLRAGTLDLPDPVAAAVGRFAQLLPAGARVLEIGSAGGRDAAPWSRPA